MCFSNSLHFSTIGDTNSYHHFKRLLYIIYSLKFINTVTNSKLRLIGIPGVMRLQKQKSNRNLNPSDRMEKKSNTYV